MNDDPPRWLDAPDVPETLRSDLLLARRTSPHPYDTGAGLAQLQAALQNGGPPDPPGEPAHVAGGSAGTRAPALPRDWPWAWLAFTGAAAAALVSWVLAASDGAVRREPAPTSAASSTPTGDSPAPPSSEAPPSWSREIAQLARTRRLLERDPAAALALAEEGQRDFPDGMFGEEREALAIFALDRLGHADQARRRGRDFLRRHPGSPFAPRVQRIVKTTSPGDRP